MEIDDPNFLSFTFMSRHCDDHLQDDDTKVCFCGRTGKSCNSYSCPRRNHNP